MTTAEPGHFQVIHKVWRISRSTNARAAERWSALQFSRTIIRASCCRILSKSPSMQQRIHQDRRWLTALAGFKLPRSKYEFGLCLFEQPRRFAHRLSGSAEWHIMIIRSVRQYRQIYTLHALIGSRNAVVIVDNALHYLNSTDSTATIALWTSVWGDQPASLEYIITSQEQK